MSDQPKIERVLKLLLTLNCKYGRTLDELTEVLNTTKRTVYRYLETIKNAGFVLEKRESRGVNYFSINKEESEYKDISELLHFSEEEAYILSQAIHTIDQQNELKINLIKKLYSLYDSNRVAVPIIKKENSTNIHALTEAINHKKQVKLINYQSSNSRKVYNRIVEPFSFTTNFVSVWAFDLESQSSKIYKTSRIGSVEIMDDWQNEEEHKEAFMDIFRISNHQKIPVKLSLSLLAKNLLTEEYPLSEKYIQKEHENAYTLETEVASLAGVGRFVMGLMDEITIHYPESLKEHISQKISKNLHRFDTN